MSTGNSDISSSTTLRGGILDIGSNSVKFMLAEQRGSELHIHHEKAFTTRLALGLIKTGKLADEPISETLDVLHACQEQAVEVFGAEKLITVGTSALRSASNPSALCTPASKFLQTPIEVISGELEGELVFGGITLHPDWQNREVLALDLGGGSLEFVHGLGTEVFSSVSFETGCVRIHERFLKAQPPSLSAISDAVTYVQEATQSHTQTLRGRNYTLVGTGGTMVTMALMHLKPEPPFRAATDADNLSISREQLQEVLEYLSSSSLETLQKNTYIPKGRADIITTGAVIFAAVMDALGADQITTVTRGLRYGAWRKWLAPEEVKTVIPGHGKSEFPANY